MRATASLSQCRRCQILTVSALCEGIEVVCDLAPLTRIGELQAAAAGRQTYRLDADRRLWRNDQYRIRADAPLPGDHRLIAHDCEHPTPAQWHAEPDPDQEAPY